SRVGITSCGDTGGVSRSPRCDAVVAAAVTVGCVTGGLGRGIRGTRRQGRALDRGVTGHQAEQRTGGGGPVLPLPLHAPEDGGLDYGRDVRTLHGEARWLPGRTRPGPAALVGVVLVVERRMTGEQRE